MHRCVFVAVALAALVSRALLAKPAAPEARSAPSSSRPATLLSFHDFFEPTPRELKPSGRLLSLNGRRVRIVGFMAHMEEPVRGAFYLCPRPTECAEGGAGTGDLPASAVRVILPGPPARTLPFTPRALEVVGRLELGPRTEADGQVSSIRIFLPSSPRRAAAARPAPAGQPARGPARPSPRGVAVPRGAKRASWPAR